ncbi:MAG: AI-2E family transporter [Acidobacteriaceae bacterium]
MLIFGAVLLLLVFAKVILIPLAFALILAFLLVPAVSMLEKQGLRRAFAVATVSAATCLCVLIGAYVLSRQVLNVAQTLPGYRANLQYRIESLHSLSAGSLEAALEMIEDLSRDLAQGAAPAQGDALPVRVVGQRSDQLQAAMRVAGSILEPVGQFGIIVIFTIYMLMNREDLRHRLLLLAGMGNINVMTQALDDASSRISQYLVMQFKVNGCYGLIFGVGLYLLHVPQATLWGVISGTLRIVPFAGTLMGMIPPLALSVATSSTWWNPLIVLALFVVVETTIANLVEPWLFSSRTGISSLALLISAIFWSMLWGWPGLVLSTPLTVCMVVLGRHVPQLSFLHSLLGTNATLSPAARLYERLLAMDQAEAWSVTENYLNGKPLMELYDCVILPVLSLAEEDRHKGVLNDVRWKFMLLSVGEIIAKLSEYKLAEPALEPKSDRSLLIEARRRQSQQEFAIVCLTARDKADELATVMLTQVLERAGYQTLILAADAASEDILRGLAGEKDTVLFLSALPPFAFAQTRGLCQRVRAHLPDNRIAIALWCTKEDSDDMVARFGAARPEVVLGTLRQALAQVESWRTTRRPHVATMKPGTAAASED